MRIAKAERETVACLRPTAYLTRVETNLEQWIGPPQVGAGVPLRGTMDREAPAVSEVARPRGVAVVFTVADSGGDRRTAAAERFAEPDEYRLAQKRPANSFPPRRTAYVFPRRRVGNGVTSFNKAFCIALDFRPQPSGARSCSTIEKTADGPFFGCLRVLQLNCFEVLPAHLRRICSGR
jgi:hypothetical protein